MRFLAVLFLAFLLPALAIASQPLASNISKEQAVDIASKTEAAKIFIKEFGIERTKHEGTIEKSVEEIPEKKQWKIEFWASNNWFPSKPAAHTRITIIVDQTTGSVIAVEPNLEYIKDSRFCRTNSDCTCLSGSGLPFVGCENFLYAPAWRSGSYTCDSCECYQNSCRDLETLVSTATPVGSSLLGAYEMLAKPDKPDGTTYWLGDLTMSQTLHYKFVDSEASPNFVKAQHDNYFMQHPDGSIEIKYEQGVLPETHLEDLTDDIPVATITFKSNDQKYAKSYSIVLDLEYGRLKFAGKDLPFIMDKDNG